MFRNDLPEDQGILLVGKRSGISESSIHMWFVFMPLGVIWIDADLMIVDLVLARPWRVYTPKSPALHVLEGRPAILDGVSIGDQLEFTDEI
jgi:uncharacterized protein